MTQCPDTMSSPTDHVASNIRRCRRVRGRRSAGVGSQDKGALAEICLDFFVDGRQIRANAGRQTVNMTKL
jgi:hypothetical protein